MWQREPSLHFEHFEDGAVIVDLAGNRLYQTNAVGLAILEAFSEPQSLQSLCDELAPQFHVEAEVLRQDVATFVNILVENRWVSNV